MMKHQTEILCAVSVLLCLSPYAAAFEAFPVWPTDIMQQTPDVDDGVVVWAAQVEEKDWDVYGFDLLDPSATERIFVAAYIGSNQMEPAIWNDRVVFQDDFEGDWDVYVADISDAAAPVDYLMTPAAAHYQNDQTNPAIHGNLAVWQSVAVFDDGEGGTFEEWDIYAADITAPGTPSVHVVDAYDYNQQSPCVFYDRVVYEDDYFVDWDIQSADLWLKDAPLYESVISDDEGLSQQNPAVWGDTVVCQVDVGDGDYDILAVNIADPQSPQVTVIATGPAVQVHPDISGHLVVWQDDRNGNWDIYGYNLITRQEFQITTEGADQTRPAISSTLVVWEDLRDAPQKPMQIYAAWLDDVTAADCPDRPAGDVNGDCRVDLADFVQLAEEWLACALDPVTACVN